jgi:hypothetical protein
MSVLAAPRIAKHPLGEQSFTIYEFYHAQNPGLPSCRMSYSSGLSSPRIHARSLRSFSILYSWILLICIWPFGDVLRKWGGLNQPIYIIQLLTPMVLAIFLYKSGSLKLSKKIFLLSFALFLVTGAAAISYLILEYPPVYLFVWALNLSTLLAPPLLICCSPPEQTHNQSQIRILRNRFISIVAFISLINNLLSVVQSILGRSHFLSVGAGGSLDAQIGTNTEIELRAPGLFTYVSGNALFSLVCFIFLMASLGSNVSYRSSIIRLFALASLPISIVRSISRFFVFAMLTVFIPFSTLFLRKAFALGSALLLIIFLLLSPFLTFLQDVVLEGFINFQKRILDTGGLQEGVFARFFSSIVTDHAGSNSSLITNLPSWISSDPLAAFFGYGLGFSSPLFRFVMRFDENYGFVTVDGNRYLVGENASTSLLADIGIIGFCIYLVLIIVSLSAFFKKYPIFPFTTSRAFAFSCFLALAIAVNLIYCRPANALYTSSVALTPSVCSILFNGPKTLKKSMSPEDHSSL